MSASPAKGSLDQIRADLEALAALGGHYVLFDTYLDLPGETLR